MLIRTVRRAASGRTKDHAVDEFVAVKVQPFNLKMMGLHATSADLHRWPRSGPPHRA